MKHPMLYGADQIKNWDCDEQKIDSESREYWQPARPLGIGGIKARLILAWNVFIGRYDALNWKDESA